MQYTEKGIQFNDVLESNFFVGGSGPLTSNKNYKKNVDGSIRHIKGDYLVNAIDIHWNGASLPDVNPEEPTKLTSTSDLLNALNNAYKTINQLKEQLEEFQLQVNNELTSLNQKYTDIETNLEVFANNI